MTKCRYIVEAKFGEIKRNDALSKCKRRRKTEIGHLQIDYRIACAMLNFLHKPSQSDKEVLKRNFKHGKRH